MRSEQKLATLLIQDGLIGKVSRVRAWCPKNWGYDGPEPTGKRYCNNGVCLVFKPKN